MINLKIPSDYYEIIEEGDDSLCILLKRGAVVDGVPCKIGSKAFFSKKGLQKATISEDSFIQGVPCAADTEVVFYGTRLVDGFLSKDAFLDGKRLKAGTRIKFYDDADLKVHYVVLRENADFNGIPCLAGLRDDSFDVIRNEDGKETEVRSPFVVEFWREGFVKKAALYRDFEYKGIVYKNGGDIEFFKNGDVERGELAGEQVIQNIKCQGHIGFGKDRKLISAILAGSQNINGIPCRGDSFISFHKDGKIQNCTLSEDFEIHGVSFHEGDFITFLKDGKVQKN